MKEKTLYHLWAARGEILLETTFHVGSGQASALSDKAVRRDSQGQPYIPGTSLAGLLRASAEELSAFVLGVPACRERNYAENCLVCDLFGWVSRQRMGAASRIYVEDAHVCTDLPGSREVRDHLGLNRQRGVAQPNLKFTQEVAPGGVRFGFEISIEDASAADIQLILAVLKLWEKLGFQLGGRTTTGLGKAKLENVQFYGLDFSDKVILRDYLLDEQPFSKNSIINREDLEEIIGAKTVSEPRSKADTFLPQHIYLDIRLTLEEPLLVATSGLGFGEPDADFVRTINADGSEIHVIPGSGLKGVLRTRAGKIIRTLDFYRAYEHANDAHQDAESADAAYRQHISACAVTQIEPEGGWENLAACFGTPQAQRDVENTPGEDIYDRSCALCKIFGNSMMRGRLTVGEGRLVENASVEEKTFDHVAIDRFTGGTSDAKKFDTRPILSDSNPSFEFRLHLERPEPWMLGLLGLLLKDLGDGDIRIGHASRRGYGKVSGRVEMIHALWLPGSKLSQYFEFLPIKEGPGPYQAYSFPLDFQNPETDSAKAIQRCHREFLEMIDYPVGQEKGGLP